MCMAGHGWLAELGTVHRVIDKGKPGKREEVSNFFLTDLAGDMTKICWEFLTFTVRGWGTPLVAPSPHVSYLPSSCLLSPILLSLPPSLISCHSSLVSRILSLVSHLLSLVSGLSYPVSRISSLVTRLLYPVSRLSSPVSLSHLPSHPP